jgi:tetratricopeptide (TPR) repeat protein
MDGEAIPRLIGMSLCAAALMAAVPLRAQQDQNRIWCENRDGVATAEQSIAGCTALIEAGTAAAANVPVLYNNRGIAYRAKGDLDRAISDYSEAIRLDPSYDIAYFNRGRARYLKRDSTAPSPTTARACASIRNTARPMSIAASPTSPSAIRPAQSATTARRSGSIRATPMRSTCAAWPIA